MKYYQDITLLPNEEEDIPLHFLWSKIYQQVHLALVETLTDNKTSIGVAFPQYRDGVNLGCELRVLAKSEQELVKLDLSKWLSRLTDYAHITSIRPVPDDVKTYARFKRYQPSSINKERLARRRAKRHNETHDQAMEYYQDWQPKKVKEPFIRLKSLSSGYEHCVFIKKEHTESLVNEGFSSYGLSKTSSLPDF